MKTLTQIKCKSQGFSLIELAIVLFIVTLLLGGLLPTISSQYEQKRTAETLKQLDDIQQALIGFAIINGRLPCPASSTSNGDESFASPGDDASTGKCSNNFDGFVPAATLGISNGVDSNGLKGFAVDAWGYRIHYAVTQTTQNLTKNNGMSTAGISNIPSDLLVCFSASAITPTSCGGNSLTSLPGVPIVIFSTGSNSGHGGISTDEAANLDGNRTFVSHTPTSSPNEFDDIVIWVSPNVLINRMVTAGKLP